MSKRRKVGDWVWLTPNSMSTSDSFHLYVEIMDDGGWSGCLDNCGDPDCFEWYTLLCEPDPENNERTGVGHYNECQMLDKPWRREENTQ